MQRDQDALPPELQQLDLKPDQIIRAKRYIGLQIDYARRQRRTVVGLCMVVCGALVVRSIMPGANDALPFESVVDVAFRWMAGAAAVLATISVAVYQVMAYQLKRHVGQMGFSPSQAERLRELGDTTSRYVLFGRLGLLGRKPL